jgi:hypothetical protein
VVFHTRIILQELQQQYIPELKMRYGPACSALKKLWTSYKIAGRNSEPRGDIAWLIRNIQSAMGIEKSTFPELEGMEDDNEESEVDQNQGLTDEELEAQKEEQQENGGEWNLNSGTSEESESDEWSKLDKQLLKEEIEAEQENDDW